MRGFLLISTFTLAATLAAMPALAGDLAPMALNSLTRPPAALASAKVMNPQGQVIGEVSGVVTDPTGKLTAVKVAEANGVTTIPSASASYDAEKNVVVADAAPAKPAIDKPDARPRADVEAPSPL